MTNPTRLRELVLSQDFFDHYLSEAKPYPIDVRRGFYINGILNEPRDSRDGANTLYKTLERRLKVVPIFSPTETPHFDLLQQHGDGLGSMDCSLLPLVEAIDCIDRMRKISNYTNFEIRRLNREIQWSCLSLDAMNDPRKIYLFAFSRGNSVVYNACKDLPQHLKDRLMFGLIH